MKHLLEIIEIKDFKCFKDFKAEGFKRVNLIGGKNNVGKTAFMEACCINVSSSSKSKFVDNSRLSNNDLTELFASVRKQGKEELLYEYINEFDESIINFKDKHQWIILDNEFGDGLKHYISIVCSLFAFKNGYLFIDDIDNGIHYTLLDKLWEIILTISKEQNVQVFATTHSKECIESYARVSNKLEDEDICFIELGKNKENKLDSIVYNYDMVQSEIKQNHEIRGW
jgi:AAA15 family ATPase/GTPase